MFERLLISRMAGALASHATQRQSVIARNVANADTPDFKARDLPAFATLVAEAGTAPRATRPGHLGSPDPLSAARTIPRGGEASPNGNDVALEDEMMAAAEVRQSQQMALGIYRSVSAMMRTSLGRAS